MREAEAVPVKQLCLVKGAVRFSSSPALLSCEGKLLWLTSHAESYFCNPNVGWLSAMASSGSEKIIELGIVSEIRSEGVVAMVPEVPATPAADVPAPLTRPI